MAFRRLIPFLAATLAWSAAEAPAWTPAARRAAVRIAQERAGEDAVRALRYLVGADFQLEEWADWSDRAIEERPETEAWRSITIPPDAEFVDYDRDCPVGDCLPVKIREFEGVLRLAHKDKEARIEALKFLLGLAVDLHQPLNASYPPGQGGDEIKVVVEDRETTLRQFWDSAVPADVAVDELAAALRARITNTALRDWLAGTLKDWTWDTHLVAVRSAYAGLPAGSPKVLDEEYRLRARAVAEEQLAKAAVRLAALLDRIWPAK